ncbi:MAG TPA: aspartate aminotransferase family protein, partial [Candidatus Eisenbacteria bacterium]
GAFARGLASGRRAALALHAHLAAHPGFTPLLVPELDIVVWAVRAEQASVASGLSRQLFEAAARHDLHLAVATLPRRLAEKARPVSEWDEEMLVCLRACVMKPEHEAWLPEIVVRLDRAAAECGVQTAVERP